MSNWLREWQLSWVCAVRRVSGIFLIKFPKKLIAALNKPVLRFLSRTNPIVCLLVDHCGQNIFVTTLIFLSEVVLWMDVALTSMTSQKERGFERGKNAPLLIKLLIVKCLKKNDRLWSPVNKLVAHWRKKLVRWATAGGEWWTHIKPFVNCTSKYMSDLCSEMLKFFVCGRARGTAQF